MGKQSKHGQLRLVRVESRLAEHTKKHQDGPYMTIVEFHAGPHPAQIGFEETIRGKVPGITQAQLNRARRKALKELERRQT